MSLDDLDIRPDELGAVLAVKVVPGASRDHIAGVLGDALKVTVTAAPEKGKANTAVSKLLARALDLDRRHVTVQTGQTQPRKTFLLTGLTVDETRRRLADALA